MVLKSGRMQVSCLYCLLLAVFDWQRVLTPSDVGAEEVSFLSEKDLKALGAKISSQWRKIAPKFGLSSSTLTKIEAEHSTEEGWLD